MNTEKGRVLEMVEKGTISAEDGAKLLECLGETEEKQAAQVQKSAARMKGKCLHVKVNGLSGENQKINVNVSVPLVLARYADNIIANCVPTAVSEELSHNGIDLRGLNIAGIIDVFEEIEEDIVNAEIGEPPMTMQVRVYVE